MVKLKALRRFPNGKNHVEVDEEFECSQLMANLHIKVGNAKRVRGPYKTKEIKPADMVTADMTAGVVQTEFVPDQPE